MQQQSSGFNLSPRDAKGIQTDFLFVIPVQVRFRLSILPKSWISIWYRQLPTSESNVGNCNSKHLCMLMNIITNESNKQFTHLQ